MRRKILVLSIIMTVVIMLLPINSKAATDPNIDNGGGRFGDGTPNNKWSIRDEGVRATVVDAVTGSPVSISIDISNVNASDIRIHFGKVSKSGYRNGASLRAQLDGYTNINPAVPLPKIIPTSTIAADIQSIRNYFADENVIRFISGYVGINYDDMISGSYKLLIEPVAYVTFEGQRVAFTATEAAMYNGLTGGLLRRKLGSLTHKNLPLALFLERNDAGYQVWTGSRTEKTDDANIISFLGLGIVRFTDDIIPEIPPTPDPPDYIYRTDTDVITAVTVGGGYSNPSHKANVKFRILGREYRIDNVYYPEDGSQLVWVKWHTPSTPQRVTVEVISDRYVNKTNVICDIEKLVENPPPNPVADDRNPGFSIPAVPNNYNITNSNWTVWACPWHPFLVWHPNMEWVPSGHLPSCRSGCTIRHGSWEDHGRYVDEGWWEYRLDHYHANLNLTANLVPDDTSPTTYGEVTKSGYGVCLGITSGVSTNDSSAVTNAQTALTYFPEFNYGTYWRMLEELGGYLTFKENPYSTFSHRVHFTPIWYPDGTYTTYSVVYDAWTPGGMLGKGVSDSITINSNLWSDWHLAPENPD